MTTTTEAPAWFCACGCGRALAAPSQDGYAKPCRARWHDQGRPEGGPRPPRMARRELHEARLSRLETLREDGLTYAQAADVMGVTKRMAEHYATELRRRKRVLAGESLWPSRPQAPVVRWQDAAACQGHEAVMFGPEDELFADRQVREARAKTLCVFCPVRLECLDAAERQGDKYGVWAGLGEDERAAGSRRPHRRKQDDQRRAERAAARERRREEAA